MVFIFTMNRDGPNSRIHREKEDSSKQSRVIRYKDKYQIMRNKFERATVMNDEFQRDLEFANMRIKKLQSENDLLLDAMSIADANIVERYFPSRPPDEDAPASNIPPEAVEDNNNSRPNSNSNPVSRPPRRMSTSRSISNGASNGISNGTRSTEHLHDNPRPLDYVPQEANGRSS